MDPALLTVNLVVVAAELAVVLLTTTFAYLLVRALVGRLARLPGAASRAGAAEAVRRKAKTALALGAAILCLAILVLDGVLIYRGADLLAHGRDWLSRIPPGFWLGLGISALKVLALVAGAALALRYLRRLLHRAEAAAKAYQQIRANDESIQAFFRALERLLTHSGWLLVLAFSARALGLPAPVAGALFLLLRIYLTVTLGLLVVKGLDAVLDSADALSAKYSSPDNLLRYYDRLRHLIPLLKRCLEYIVYVWVATLVALEVEFIAGLAEHGPRIVRVIGIFFISRVVIEVANLAVDELLLKKKDKSPERHQRRLTFAPLLKSFLTYAIYFGAGVAILQELGVDPTPILAGAGIAGLAVGLGAQNLINDVVSGFFILFETHYLVGDFVEIGDARGTVEAIDLRTTRVRGPNGQLHILRNGQIGEVVNYSKEYIHAVVEVGVAYESDLAKVQHVLEQVGHELAKDNPLVLEPTTVQGLQNFGESELLIRTVTRVRPGQHLGVARELRRRIKEAFDREGIEIPYARRVLIVKGEEGMERLVEALGPRGHEDPTPGTRPEKPQPEPPGGR